MLSMAEYPHALLLSLHRRLGDGEIFMLTSFSALFYFFLFSKRNSKKNNLCGAGEQCVSQDTVELNKLSQSGVAPLKALCLPVSLMQTRDRSSSGRSTPRSPEVPV